MPKIIIREIDNTPTGRSEYENFAVVVPGFVIKNTATDLFDDNGVCIFEGDPEAFKNDIGLGLKKETVAGVDATPPEYADDWKDGPTPLTEADFDNYSKAGDLYVCTPRNDEGEIGAYRDANYIYTNTEDIADDSYVFDTDEPDGDGSTLTLFVKLKATGTDAIEAQEATHYGNQIAYELLRMGYTVLYKELSGLTDLADSDWWKPLKDKSLYDFRYLVSGLIDNINSDVYHRMIEVAGFTSDTSKFDSIDPQVAGRGDCIALLDVDKDVYKGKGQEAAINEILATVEGINSKYAAIFAPTVSYVKTSLDDTGAFDENNEFPASFHYLACAAKSAERYSEWYANAGYTRGTSNYVVDSVSCKFGEAAINLFQQRFKNEDKNILVAVNPIISLRGSYYLWGNRTALALNDPASKDAADLQASHFLNIRQLCTTLKKQIYMTCRQNMFDPNSDALWINFCNSIKPTLEKMKADQGILDYKIIKVKSNRKAFLSAIVRIVPIEAVEDFDISVYLENSLGGIEATMAE